MRNCRLYTCISRRGAWPHAECGFGAHPSRSRCGSQTAPWKVDAGSMQFTLACSWHALLPQCSGVCGGARAGELELQQPHSRSLVRGLSELPFLCGIHCGAGEILA